MTCHTCNGTRSVTICGNPRHCPTCFPHGPCDVHQCEYPAAQPIIDRWLCEQHHAKFTREAEAKLDEWCGMKRT